MYYVIQENVFREKHYNMLIETLERFELEHCVVRIFPFSDKVVKLSDIPEGSYNLEDLLHLDLARSDVFVFGAVKLARVAVGYDWAPGSLLNKNHDFKVYREHYRENLLNWDSQVRKVIDLVEWKRDGTQGQLQFIRPVKDSKTFTGALFTESEWDHEVVRMLNNDSSFTLDTEIQIASPKNIQKEIRCWVVGGKIITASQYKLGSTTQYDSVVEPEALEFAQRMVDVFQLAEAFVIDVCLVGGEWKIVECGCINCAGFYHSDVQRTISALETHFNR